MMRARTKNRGILTAIEVLKEMSLTKRIRDEYEYHQKVRRDQEAREDYVYDQGKAAGVSEGENRGKETEIFDSVFENDYSVERGAEKLNISKKEFEVKYQSWLRRKAMPSRNG